MTRDPAGITAVIRDMEIEVDAIANQITDLIYFAGGGLGYNEAWGMCFIDRQRMAKNLTAKLKAKAGDTTEYM